MADAVRVGLDLFVLDPLRSEALEQCVENLPSRTPLPKARRTDTPAYEWTMLHRDTHIPAMVKIKSGHQAVGLDALAAAAPDDNTTLFAYSAAEEYNGKPSRDVTCIQTGDLLQMAEKHSMLLPPRVRTWFELAKPPSD